MCSRGGGARQDTLGSAQCHCCTPCPSMFPQNKRSLPTLAVRWRVSFPGFRFVAAWAPSGRLALSCRGRSCALEVLCAGQGRLVRRRQAQGSSGMSYSSGQSLMSRGTPSVSLTIHIQCLRWPLLPLLCRICWWCGRGQEVQWGILAGENFVGDTFATLEIPKALCAIHPNDCNKTTRHAPDRESKIATH